MLWLTILNSITLLDLLALVIMTGVQIALHLREPPLITTLLLLGGVGRLALLAWSLLKESRLSLTLLSIYSTVINKCFAAELTLTVVGTTGIGDLFTNHAVKTDSSSPSSHPTTGN